jgi:hypothetical protein
MKPFSLEDGDNKDNTVYVSEYNETYYVCAPASVSRKVNYQYLHSTEAEAEAEARRVAAKSRLRLRYRSLAI